MEKEILEKLDLIISLLEKKPRKAKKKLTWQERSFIWYGKNSDESVSEWAERFKVSIPTIYQIRKGRPDSEAIFFDATGKNPKDNLEEYLDWKKESLKHLTINGNNY